MYVNDLGSPSVLPVHLVSSTQNSLQGALNTPPEPIKRTRSKSPAISIDQDMQRQLEAYNRTITIVVWYKAHSEPIRLQHTVTTFPYFQVLQLPALSSELGLAAGSYIDAFDPLSGKWEQHTMSTVRLVVPQQRLLYKTRRSLLAGLEENDCPGLPDEVRAQSQAPQPLQQRAVKRPAPEPAPGPPQKVHVQNSYYTTRVPLSTDTITPTTDPGPAIFTGAAPGYSVIEPTLYDAPPSSSQASLPSPTTTPTSTSALPTPNPTPPAIQAPAPAIPYHPHPPLKRWPNDYTVSELSAGFHAIDALLLRAPSPPPTDPSAPSTPASSNTPSANTDPASPPLPPPAQTTTTATAMTQRTAFERVFGSRYVKSTVCRHRAVWRRAPPELRAEFERRGADMERASWGEFVRCVEGRAPAKGVGVGCSEGAALVQHQQQQQQYKHQHQQQHQHQHQHQHHPQAKVSVQRPPGLAEEPLMASLQSHSVDKSDRECRFILLPLLCSFHFGA
ncbi:hypothetical protein H0H81_012667 [Sphagnurus paluster]|uniref:Uncharacterized protein n=1 Tax=Sphagnurus paluster TaxID=117069 RepID=A0A9P7GGP8_9AGAR|nr:hypothetical protein H0H81_012667 [Sphagnurus paluster]